MTGARRSSLPFLALLTVACSQDRLPDAGSIDQAVPAETYAVRLDSESSDVDLFQVIEDGDGIRVRTGPAGIAYRSEDAVQSGDFRVGATFVQYGAPVGYREAFGIFVGGLDLQATDQEYTYLLVRTSGDYLIKRRIGEITQTLVDWTPHDAVERVIEEGDQPVNTLSVDVVDDETRFLVNGVAVETLPTSRVRPYGITGVRVNHRLDVRVDGWALGPRQGT
jgi:hypothetical protein